jgi:hypothetical protein
VDITREAEFLHPDVGLIEESGRQRSLKRVDTRATTELGTGGIGDVYSSHGASLWSRESQVATRSLGDPRPVRMVRYHAILA